MSIPRIPRRSFLKTAAALLGAGFTAPALQATSWIGAGTPPVILSRTGTRRRPSALGAGQIIADHTVVDRFNLIPDEYISIIKTWFVTIPGESHSKGYRTGCSILNSVEGDRYKVVVGADGATPEDSTSDHLRIGRTIWGNWSSATGWKYSHGEKDWYTNSIAIQRIKDSLEYANNAPAPANRRPIAAMGFGWCWDMAWGNNVSPDASAIDPVFQVKWAGASCGTPEDPNSTYGLRWGLDAGDSTTALTGGNSVCMDTYLHATQQYLDYCLSQGFSTKIFFTTGPVDGSCETGERGYQRHIKHDYLRNFVTANPARILFDFGDILSWSNGGLQQTATWQDHGGVNRTFQCIHPDNNLNLDGADGESTSGYHFGERGALRLGKALWWMLARMAGWSGGDGDPPSVPLSLDATAVSFHQVDLTWDPSTDSGSGVDHYRIYRNGWQIATSPDTSYSDLGAPAGRLLSYTVSAVDAEGNASSQSSPAEATTPDAPYSVFLPSIRNSG